jgi:redox-sensitive bicupin YhaK (pirin superfamily)
MEIISIPLEGDLEHKDSMGNTSVIRKGDIQVMSAGTGIFHSEYNHNRDREVKFLQIWVFPDKKNVTPRYGQITLQTNDRHNRLQQIVSPEGEENGAWIHQNAWFYLSMFDKGFKTEYSLKTRNSGVYAFVLNGDLSVNGQELHSRDGYGIWDEEKLKISAESDCEFLLMDVPMVF